MARKICLLALLIVLFASVKSWAFFAAMDKKIGDEVNSQDYSRKTGGMLLRGATGIAGSPYELFYHGFDCSMEGTPWGLGFWKGIGIGLYWTGDKLCRSAWDVLSAPWPGYRGEPGTHNDSL